jgi:hypothetical protein
VSGWLIEVQDDTGLILLAVRVDDVLEERDAALVLALAAMKRAKHHLPSSGAILRLQVML